MWSYSFVKYKRFCVQTIVALEITSPNTIIKQKVFIFSTFPGRNQHTRRREEKSQDFIVAKNLSFSFSKVRKIWLSVVAGVQFSNELRDTSPSFTHKHKSLTFTVNELSNSCLFSLSVRSFDLISTRASWRKIKGKIIKFVTKLKL